jgi:hypothetical protein
MTGCGGGSSGWTSAQKAEYLASCHSAVLSVLPGPTHEQRVTYCAAQLKNAEKYNPHHTNVHGFVGAYTVTSP